MRCREKGVTAPFLATLGRSSLERSSKERYVLRRQKLVHSVTRPCSLSSALVVGFLDPEPPAPIATSDFNACCVWLSEGGPAEPPWRRRRPGDNSSGRLLDLRRSRKPDLDLGDESSLGDPAADLLRRPPGSGECDDRRLPRSRGKVGAIFASSSATSNMSLESSSLSLKIPSRLGRLAAPSELFLRVVLPRTFLPLLRRRPLLWLVRLALVRLVPSAGSLLPVAISSFRGTDGSEDSVFGRASSVFGRASSRCLCLDVLLPSSTLWSGEER